MSPKRGNRSKYAPDGSEYHPSVKQLISEGDWDSVKLIAGIARSMNDQDQFTHRSDAGLASDLLYLQDEGFITLEADDEDVSITLHPSPEHAERHREGWSPGTPPKS
jgi:hypothetical protein